MRFDVASYLEDNIQDAKRSGDEINGVCPDCGKAGRFYANAESGSYICFKCQFKGKGFSGLCKLVGIIEGLDDANAARFIVKRSEVQMGRKEPNVSILARRIRLMRDRNEATPTAEEAAVDAPLPHEFIPVYDAAHDKWRFPTYLKERGITKQTARERGLGFCSRGRYQGRIIIPVVCPNGSAFTARDTTGQREPRYLNPKGVDFGRLLFGWRPETAVGDFVLVEGPIDEIKTSQDGFPALGLGGKALKTDQLNLLCDRSADSAAYIMCDPEELDAPFAIGRQLLVHFSHVFICHLSGEPPEGDEKLDPGNATLEQKREAMDGAVRFYGERSVAINATVQNMRERLSRMYR